MERKDTNRANQLPIEKQYQKGVKLIDIDTTIAEYMGASIIPEVDKNVIGDFTYVWEESKAYIIGCGIFLLSLFIIIIVLLMYKAAN